MQWLFIDSEVNSKIALIYSALLHSTSLVISRPSSWSSRSLCFGLWKSCSWFQDNCQKSWSCSCSQDLLSGSWLGLGHDLEKRSWPWIFKTETSRPRQRLMWKMFLLTYSQIFIIKLVFREFIVHKLEWIPVLDTFCRSLLFSRAFCKVLVSISRPLLKVLGLV
jgi:hypothetical protein